MDWLTDIIPYISWVAVLIVLFLPPTSNSKKLKELEHRIEELERELQRTK